MGRMNKTRMNKNRMNRFRKKMKKRGGALGVELANHKDVVKSKASIGTEADNIPCVGRDFRLIKYNI